ncbi:MAG: alpha-glucosidase [Clostridia bacterium]|nr:alpha-glucosidase [Clostridia bacterium]
MAESNLLSGVWTLTADGLVLAAHRPDRPFATAIRREKTYTADRGTVKEQITETARIPLTAIAGDSGAFTLSAEGRSLSVTVSTDATGAALTFSGEDGWAYAFALPAIDGEAVFGGGEQYRQVNLRGETVVNFVSEHIKAKTVLEKALLPRCLYREKPHSAIGSYAPMPVFQTDRGRLIRFDTESDGTSVFADDGYRFEFDACPRGLFLSRGESFAALSRILAAQIPNRQYLPDWCFDGMILGVQGGTQRILDKAFAMLDAGAKVCGVWSQDWSGFNRTVMGYQVWWNWEADETLYPDLKGAIRKLNARGVRFLAYINPYLVRDSRLYNECREKGWLITHPDGSVYHIKSTTFDAGMLDLTDPDAVRFIKDVLIKQNMLDLGVSGWMADFGEYLPVDCVLHDGDPKQLHNLWPVLWAKINREAIEEYGAKDAMFFMRSGYVGVQSYAPVLWNGDQHTDTTKDYGMPCVMPASFSLGFSGAPMVHSDIGGFFSFGKLKRNGELFTRWMEMNAFSLLMRSHESIRPWANAQFDAPDVLPYTVRLTAIHAQLKPYIQHCAQLAGQGIPAMRPDFWETGSYMAERDPYSYYLGDDLYVCPVIEPKARTRQVFLPPGDWVDLWSGKEFPGWTMSVWTFDAPLGQPPVFYKKDSAFAPLFEQIRMQSK